MNIVQLHDKVLGYLDQARSGRIHPTMLDAALNTSHISILNQKIGLEGFSSSPSFPEENVRMKDSLGYYYKTVTINSSNHKLNFPANLSLINARPLMLLLNLEVNIGTIGSPNWIIPSPVNTKDKTELSGNTFLSPKSTVWNTTYFTYSGGFIELFFGMDVSIVQYKIGYLKQPVSFSFGIMKSFSDMQTDNTMVLVSSPRVVYDSIVKFRGEEFEVVNHNLLTIGEVFTDYSIVDVDPKIVDLLSSMSASAIANMRMGVLNSGKEN
jgi:hypothetical protein